MLFTYSGYESWICFVGGKYFLQAGICLRLSLASIIMLRLIAFEGRSVRLFLMLLEG